MYLVCRLLLEKKKLRCAPAGCANARSTPPARADEPRCPPRAAEATAWRRLSHEPGAPARAILSLHDALPICRGWAASGHRLGGSAGHPGFPAAAGRLM